jgi:hypothetical protein
MVRKAKGTIATTSMCARKNFEDYYRAKFDRMDVSVTGCCFV